MWQRIIWSLWLLVLSSYAAQLLFPLIVSCIAEPLNIYKCLSHTSVLSFYLANFLHACGMSYIFLQLLIFKESSRGVTCQVSVSFAWACCVEQRQQALLAPPWCTSFLAHFSRPSLGCRASESRSPSWPAGRNLHRWHGLLAKHWWQHVVIGSDKCAF